MKALPIEILQQQLGYELQEIIEEQLYEQLDEPVQDLMVITALLPLEEPLQELIYHQLESLLEDQPLNYNR
jgi:hypothetical protein